MLLPRPGHAARPSLSVDAKDWRDAFQAQCTKELMKIAKRHAERRARKLRQAGGRVDDDYLRSLVQDVLGDTTMGILCWDPCTESLEDHVMDAIATRVHHDVVRARRFPHASIDDADPDTARATLAAADAALLAVHDASPATVRLSEDSLGELCEMVTSDEDLQRVLGALAMGATCKDDILFVTGMSDAEYRAARHRLDRLLPRLPRHARPSASLPPNADPSPASHEPSVEAPGSVRELA
jgi:hypothetical protein